MGKLVNKRELAEIVGKSQQTVTTWQKNGLPMESDGTKGRDNIYDTGQVIDWLIAREINARIKERGSEDEFYDFEKERARLTFHNANKASLEERVLNRSLIEASTVKEVWADLITAFRAKILGIPTKSAHKFLSVTELNESQEILKEDLQEALAELSEYSIEQYDIRTS